MKASCYKSLITFITIHVSRTGDFHKYPGNIFGHLPLFMKRVISSPTGLPHGYVQFRKHPGGDP